MEFDKIHLSNFKNHKNSVIELSKITILIGPTNSGKSSILQSLLMLKTTCQRNQDSFITQHTSYDYGQFQDIVTLGKTNDIHIGIEGKIELEHYVTGENPLDTKFNYSVTFNEQGKKKIKLRVEVGRYGADVTFPHNDSHDLYAWDTEPNTALDIIDYDINGFNPKFRVQIKDVKAQSIINDLFQNGMYTRQLLDRFYYIPFSRTVTSNSS